jgi:two-component system sensor histidine kinase/response regulator
MGGEIGVTSVEGHGSTFWFTARLAVAAADTAAASPRQVRPLRGARVLVVDDNATNRLILEEQLSGWGAAVTCANDGFDALAKLRGSVDEGLPYTLVVLDMHMPGMDGIEVAHAIRLNPAIAGARLLLLTSLAQGEDGEVARRAGIDAWLTKPVRQAHLIETIVRVLDGADETAHPASAHEERQPSEAPVCPSRGHILLVEDSRINQLVGVGILESLGYTVEVVGDGLEAVEAARRSGYAAILMDIQMPRMDGYTAAAQIRANEAAASAGRPHTPIVAMTANALNGERERCLAAGMDDYLSKPIRSELVEGVLGRWIGNGVSPAITLAVAEPTE